MKMKCLLSILTAGLAMASAHAGLLVYEAYDYPAESEYPDLAALDLDRMGKPASEGGSGLTTPNRTFPDRLPLRIAAEGLEYTDTAGRKLVTAGKAAIVQEGNSVFFLIYPPDAGDPFEALRSPENAKAIGHPGKEVWFSQLMHVSGPLHAGQDFSFKFGGGQTSLPIGYVNGSPNRPPSITVVSMGDKMPMESDHTYLLVGRMTYGETKEENKFDLWIDPEIGTEVPGSDPAISAKNFPLTFESLMYSKHNAEELTVTFDELRIGETFQDVTPAVP